MTRLKVADLTSGIGALVLGVGLGALFSPLFAPAAGFIAIAGVAAHGFGMWDKHRLEAQAQVESVPWVVALYWVCWLLLAAAVVLLFLRR
jgi:hypothetical protein